MKLKIETKQGEGGRYRAYVRVADLSETLFTEEEEPAAVILHQGNLLAQIPIRGWETEAQAAAVMRKLIGEAHEIVD